MTRLTDPTAGSSDDHPLLGQVSTEQYLRWATAGVEVLLQQDLALLWSFAARFNSEGQTRVCVRRFLVDVAEIGQKTSGTVYYSMLLDLNLGPPSYNIF